MTRTIEHKYFADEMVWEWVGTVTIDGYTVEFFGASETDVRRSMSAYIASVYKF